jgi:hypothetical protein
LERQANPKAINRTGRVLHWAFALLAGLVVAITFLIGVAEAVDVFANPTGHYGDYAYHRSYDEAIGWILGGFAGGLFFALVGRALRYILSGE